MGCLLKAGGGLHARVAIGAVLLAAGAGSRLGGRPKSLLELGGVPLIRRQLIALSGAGVDEVVVVLGHHAALIEPAVLEFPVTLVRNPSPDDGQPSSVVTGLRALGPRLDAVIVALADQPLIQSQDVVALIAAFIGVAAAFYHGIEVMANQKLRALWEKWERLAAEKTPGSRQLFP